MKEDKLTPIKAADSVDTVLDSSYSWATSIVELSFLLIYQVLLHLHKGMPLGSFFCPLEEGAIPLYFLEIWLKYIQGNRTEKFA